MRLLNYQNGYGIFSSIAEQLVARSGIGPMRVNLDKWMWLTRIYKTRSQATEACNKNKIDVNGLVSKPSKLLKKDDIVLVRKNYIEYQYKTTDSPKSRIPAKRTPDYFEDITLDSEKEKLINRKKDFNLKFYRDKGMGRPTKKDRRIIDKFLDKHE